MKHSIVGFLKQETNLSLQFSSGLGVIGGEKYIRKVLPKPKKKLDGEVVKSKNWTSK